MQFLVSVNILSYLFPAMCLEALFLFYYLFLMYVENPIGPRKVQIMEAKQMRKNISKTINQTLEDRLVSQVSQGGRPLTVIGRKATDEAKAEKAKNKGKK